MARYVPITVTMSEAEYYEHTNDYDGVCLACGEWTFGGCEPDARRYPCESCNRRAVYGAEEALMMGYIEFTEETEDSHAV